MSNKEQHIEKEEQLQEEKHEEQQKTEETEVEAVNGVDPLEEAILRVQELEAQLTEMVKKEQDFLLRSRAEMDNIRRRAEQDVEKAHKFGLEILKRYFKYH